MPFDKSSADGIEGQDIDPSTVTTDSISVGGQPNLNLWPLETETSVVVNDNNPPSTYQTASVTAAPANASFVVLNIRGTGDGTAARATIEVREGGVSRSRDTAVHTWAGHGAIQGGSQDIIPLNANNEIEYRNSDENLASLRLTMRGYF